jgi:hypothetical protein
MYKKGQSGNLKGRPKGSKNKVNTELKNAIDLFLMNKMDEVEDLWDSLSPRAKSTFFMKLMPYVLPLAQKEDVEAEYEPITITIVKPDGDKV